MSFISGHTGTGQGGSAIAHSWLEPGGICRSAVSKGKTEFLGRVGYRVTLLSSHGVQLGVGTVLGQQCSHSAQGVVRTLFQPSLGFNMCRLMVSAYRYHRAKLTVEISSDSENGHLRLWVKRAAPGSV